jgi:protein SCO1/2
VTFIFTLCTATCPVLTPMMSLVQDQLGSDFGNRVVFASITVDPERDTPDVLKLYAQMYGADVAGWSFLTGPPPIIQDLTRRYGVRLRTRAVTSSFPLDRRSARHPSCPVNQVFASTRKSFDVTSSTS